MDEAGDEQALKLSASVVMDLDGLQEEIKTIPRLKDKQVDCELSYNPLVAAD